MGSNPALTIRHGTTPTPGLRYKNLGKSGLRVSNVGLGTWPIFSPGVPEEQSEAIVKLAYDSGINIFDISEAHSGRSNWQIVECCWFYRFPFFFRHAEVELGKIIQKHAWKRAGYVVTIKIYWSMKSEERGLSRKHIIESVKASLLRLQLSYVDVVIIYKADPMCPMEGESPFILRFRCISMPIIRTHAETDKGRESHSFFHLLRCWLYTVANRPILFE